ncbi:MAG: hypothetical protein ACK4PR_12045, partial [Gammaproteobacteria bacterium]
KDYAGLLNGLGWQVLSEMLKEVQPAYCGLLSTIKEKIALSNVLAASKAQSKVQQDFAAREQGLLTSLQEITQTGQADYLQLLENFWRCVHRLRDLISDKSPHVWSAGRSLILMDSSDKVLLNAYDIASPASLLDEAELNRLFAAATVNRQEGDKVIKKVAKPVLFKKLKGQIKELERVEKQIGVSCQKLRRDMSESAANLLSAKQEVLKYLAGIREGYQTYQKLIEGIVISQLKDYAFPRAYLQSGVVGHHWLTPDANDLAEFKEKEKWQSGTSVIRVLQGVHFKENPHAPGVEFMVSRLGKLLAGQGATPTALLKVIDKTGWPHIYQASKTVVGKELKTVIEHHPQAISRINPANFSAMCILSILTDPQDGKPDNYMAEFTVDDMNNIKSLEIIGIDNDIAFADVVIKKHESGSKQGEYFINVKNVLYFFPQMDQVIDPEFKAQLLKIEPVLVLTDWLGGIIEQNRIYRELLTSGVLSEIECRGATAGERGMQLPIRLAPKTVKILCHKLYQIRDAIRADQSLTHWQLLEQVQPGLAKHYAQVKDQHGSNIMASIHALYEEAISDIEELRNYQQQLAEGNTQVMTASVLKT